MSKMTAEDAKKKAKLINDERKRRTLWVADKVRHARAKVVEGGIPGTFDSGFALGAAVAYSELYATSRHIDETHVEPDSLQGENAHLKTVLHNVINAACFGNDYYNALYNIIKSVADALPDYETHRHHGVLKPNNLSTSNPTGEAG